MKNFLLSILVGIGNITPGVSGSCMMIIFNMYESVINAIANLFKDFKNSFKYLLPIGLGIILGTFLFSFVIKYFINSFPIQTSIVFLGFIMGTLPSLFKSAFKNGFKWYYVIFFLIAFILGCMFLFFKDLVIINSDNSLFSNVVLGFVLALSTVVPGISSTVLLTILGMYNTYLSAITNIDLTLIIPIVIGLVLGVFILSKIINYFLKRFYGETFFTILGFTISTIPGLLAYRIDSISSLVVGSLLGILAFFLTVKLSEKI